jgi:dihydrodipicolinate synthase/N-acetylneuraminate lyase
MAANAKVRGEKESMLVQRADKNHGIVGIKGFIYFPMYSMHGEERKLRQDTAHVATAISLPICYL